MKVGDKVRISEAARKRWSSGTLVVGETFGAMPDEGIVVQMFDRFVTVRMINRNGKPLYTTSVFYEDVEEITDEHT